MNNMRQRRDSEVKLLSFSGLSKVAGCWQKLLPTWLVSAGYSAWHFFTGDVFLKQYLWTGRLL